jgi:hypothetical protein
VVEARLLQTERKSDVEHEEATWIDERLILEKE